MGVRYNAQGPLASERGTTVKPRGGQLRVALVAPNSYYVGMSSLGFQTVYRLINERDDYSCERAFLPDDYDLTDHAKGCPPLVSVESRTPVAEFDIVAFSVSFENDYINVADAFALAKLPPLAKDRGDGWPLVVLGGVTTFFNPEPIAPFFDAVIIGEAEDVIDDFLGACRDNLARLDRPGFLEIIATIPGVYIPTLYKPSYKDDGQLESFSNTPPAPAKVKRRFTADIDARPATSAILTPDTEFSDMFMVELARGCGRHCRFCMAGYVYRPPRVRGLESVVADIRRGAAMAKKVGLVGAAVSDYPHIAELVEAVKDIEVDFSASSLRADSLTPELVGLLARGNRTVAIAPEAGSERLRGVINKNITEAQILDAVRALIDGGILNVKLYFMVGLPTEDDTDIEAIVELAKKAREVFLAASKPRGRMGTMILSVNCFIPKPWTPFQWAPMESVDSLTAKLRHVKKSLKGIPNLSVIHDVPKWAWLQGVLARGDRRLADVILRASETGGDWKMAFRERRLDMAFYAGRERAKDELFPWDFIDTGVDKGYLWDELERAHKGGHTPPCKVGKCRMCGVC